VKATFIVGVPAAGKSSIMRALLAEGRWMQWTHPFKLHQNAKRRIIVPGDYSNPDEPFPGTDRLSMSVQPRVMQKITDDLELGLQYSWVIEGDRLTNGKMIDFLLDCGPDVKLLCLGISGTVLARRQSQRQQSEAFQASRMTKVLNLMDRYPQLVHMMQNDTPQQRDRIVDWIVERHG